ncbi:MAG: hypothetical protein IKE64_14445, partial [Thermoguttaceae bacterium]|nr:hypothetical protein [Thermoguttaceae bacterium]
ARVIGEGVFFLLFVGGSRRTTAKRQTTQNGGKEGEKRFHQTNLLFTGGESLGVVSFTQLYSEIITKSLDDFFGVLGNFAKLRRLEGFFYHLAENSSV